MVLMWLTGCAINTSFVFKKLPNMHILMFMMHIFIRFENNDYKVPICENTY